MKSRCFDAVAGAIREAMSIAAPGAVLKKDRLNILSEYCEAIDRLISEFDGEHVTASVREDYTLCIELILPSIEVTPEWDIFNQLIERAVRFSVHCGGQDKTVFRFVFPSVWEDMAEIMTGN